MKIVFALESPHIGGGTNVILEHALGLHARGWEVVIAGARPLQPEDLSWHPEASKKLRLTSLDALGEEEFDVAFATWWKTAFKLHRVNARRYAYLVQSIESRFPPVNDAAAQKYADVTYTLNLPKIAIATWIQDHLKKNFASESSLVLNGIRKDLFTPIGETFSPPPPGQLRILIEGLLGVSYKNVERTIALCRQANVGEIWLLTATKGVQTYPGVDRVFSCVPVVDVPKIYRSCDVLVKLSTVEGMFGPPLEMFHCGGTSVVYRVTGAEEYIVDGENSIVIEQGDERRVVAELQRLARDPEHLNALKRGAQKTAAQWWSWEDSSRSFEAAVISLLNDESESRQMLQVKSGFFSSWYGNHDFLQCKLHDIQELRDRFKNDAAVLRSQLISSQSELNETKAALHIVLRSRSFRIMQYLRALPVIGTLGKVLFSIPDLFSAIWGTDKKSGTIQKTSGFSA